MWAEVHRNHPGNNEKGWADLTEGDRVQWDGVRPPLPLVARMLFRDGEHEARLYPDGRCVVARGEHLEGGGKVFLELDAEFDVSGMFTTLDGAWLDGKALVSRGRIVGFKETRVRSVGEEW